MDTTFKKLPGQKWLFDHYDRNHWSNYVVGPLFAFVYGYNTIQHNAERSPYACFSYRKALVNGLRHMQTHIVNMVTRG